MSPLQGLRIIYDPVNQGGASFCPGLRDVALSGLRLPARPPPSVNHLSDLPAASPRPNRAMTHVISYQPGPKRKTKRCRPFSRIQFRLPSHSGVSQPGSEPALECRSGGRESGVGNIQSLPLPLPSREGNKKRARRCRLSFREGQKV